MRSPDVIVVGGGVIGCATAFAISRAGASVLLIERDRIGAHASGAAAGMLAPLVESKEFGPGFEIGLESLELFPALVSELRELSGIDPLYVESGLLCVAEEDEAKTLKQRAQRQSTYGCEWLNPEELRSREPRLAPWLAGGLWSPREAHIDPFLLTRAYAGAAARLGTRLELGTRVTGFLKNRGTVKGVRTESGVFTAGDVVLCSGAWAREGEAWGGLRLPVEPVKGQMVSLEAPDPQLSSVISGRGAYLVPRKGQVLIGATSERKQFDVRPSASGVASLLDAASSILPVLGDCPFGDTWAGLRPCTPDHLPLVGPAPGVQGLTLALGHYREGILLSAVTGLSVADWIVSEKRTPALEAFDPARLLA